MVVKIIQGDITKVEADVIVNAANNRLEKGGGVCGAIYTAAGGELQRYTDRMWMDNGRKEVWETGTAHLTPSFNIDTCRTIIHAIGPIYNPQMGGKQLMAEMLAAAYNSSLAIAEENKYDSIAFPAISTGIYGYPMSEALDIVKTVLETTTYSGKIILVCFSDADTKSYKKVIKPWRIHLKRIMTGW